MLYWYWNQLFRAILILCFRGSVPHAYLKYSNPSHKKILFSHEFLVSHNWCEKDKSKVYIYIM